MIPAPATGRLRDARSFFAQKPAGRARSRGARCGAGWRAEMASAFATPRRMEPDSRSFPVFRGACFSAMTAALAPHRPTDRGAEPAAFLHPGPRWFEGHHRRDFSRCSLPPRPFAGDEETAGRRRHTIDTLRRGKRLGRSSTTATESATRISTRRPRTLRSSALVNQYFSSVEGRDDAAGHRTPPRTVKTELRIR